MLIGMKKSAKPADVRQTFARNIRVARHLKEISQEELAFRSNLSRSYVSEVENGGRNISIDNMGILANALGIPLHILVNPDTYTSIDSFSKK
jgi:transcriptional regulator with XRE-family HTH domain